MSVQESMEHDIILKSISLNDGCTWIELPFTQDPVEYLTKRHAGNNNRYQAVKTLDQQCKKPNEMRAGMSEAFRDLESRGFLKKTSDLTQDQRDAINASGFKHYMPYRGVARDSMSTQMRLVVDPSMTGLNMILAKGINTILPLPGILLRSRCSRHLFVTDITKMYNQLHLKQTSLAYGLVVYRDGMALENPIQEYVMLCGWYGVVSTGGQANVALDLLADKHKAEFPLAHQVLVKNRYVDDVSSGSNTSEERELVIHETSKCLEAGGFKMKYVIRSGLPPPSEASPDGTTVKNLGYRWYTSEDQISISFEDLNFNKKVRGLKPGELRDFTEQSDISQVMLTKRVIVGKVMELFDILGLVEPYKVQMKLLARESNQFQWDEVLPEPLQARWRPLLFGLLEVGRLKIPRCIKPCITEISGGAELIGFADAAAQCAGACVYLRYRMHTGEYSCGLLIAKSKLVNMTIPRNELTAVLLLAETMEMCAREMEDKVTSMVYFTDSTIAMSWINNTSKRLKLFVMHKVDLVRKSMLRTRNFGRSGAEEEEFPLYCVESSKNQADVLTKRMDGVLEKLHPASEWYRGQPWMTQDSSEFEFTSYRDLQLNAKEAEEMLQETYKDPVLLESIHCNHCNQYSKDMLGLACSGLEDPGQHCAQCTCYSDCAESHASSHHTSAEDYPEYLVNPVKMGWKKAEAVMGLVTTFVQALKHKSHATPGMAQKTCFMCRARAPRNTDLTAEAWRTSRNSEAMKYFARCNAPKVELTMNKGARGRFEKIDNVWYGISRFAPETQFMQKDLKFEVFFDVLEIPSAVPVFTEDSPVVQAIILDCHFSKGSMAAHSGLQRTYAKVCGKIYVLGRLNQMIQRVRAACTLCRLIAKKTIETRMGNHPAERSLIAPPFYAVQLDCVFGFKGRYHKNARTGAKIYALIAVCVATGATAITALESLELQDVLKGLERFAARYGAPAILYVDNGSNLMALEKAELTIQDLTGELMDRLHMEVRVTNAKSHEENGRVEVKVREVRRITELLVKLRNSDLASQTILEWETTFALIANSLNNYPIAMTNGSNQRSNEWNVITPNRLLLGRNQDRTIAAPLAAPLFAGPSKMLERSEAIAKTWYQIYIDNIHRLMPEKNKFTKHEPISVGDVVLFVTQDGGYGDATWKLGRVIEILSPNSVKIEYRITNARSGEINVKTVHRSPRSCSRILHPDEHPVNSEGFFERIT